MVPVTTTSTRLQEAPDTGNGTPVGSDDWRLVVERLNGSGSVVGACIVGSPSTSPVGDAVVGTLIWEDLTGYVRGMEWGRGADEPYGRPRVGETLLTLDNSDGRFTPWIDEYADTRPGTVMRAGLVSATDVRADGWLPLWSMLVDEWRVLFAGPRRSTVVDASGYADSYVEVRLVETLSALARIDDNAVSLQGSGDDGYDRVARLLTAAAWKFGLVDAGGGLVDPTLTLQSTDMTANRLTECYLTADSSRRRFRADVTGAACVTPGLRWMLNLESRLVDFSAAGAVPWIEFSPLGDGYDGDLARVSFDAESLEMASTPEHIVNDHRYARAGGTQQVVEHAVSVGRFGRSTRERADLICSTDANSLDIANDDNVTEARTSLRCDGLTVTATDRGEVYLLVAAVDVGNFTSLILRDDDVWLTGPVRSMFHTVTPMPGRVHWTVTYALDVSTLNGFPDGAMLDEA
jgi:hypothetical protein